MHNLPDHAATVLHDDLSPVAVPDVFAADITWLTDGRRRIALRRRRSRRRRTAFRRCWRSRRWQSRVNGPDDLAALVLVDDFDNIAAQVLVRDSALDAELLGGLRLAGFVGDFVGDGARGALAGDFSLAVVVVVALCGDLDDGSFLLVRLPCGRALAESDVRHL